MSWLLPGEDMVLGIAQPQAESQLYTGPRNGCKSLTSVV